MKACSRPPYRVLGPARISWVLGLAVLACGSPALRGAEDSLGRGVPSDAALYARYRIAPGSRMAARLERVGEAVARSGLVQDLASAAVDRCARRGGADAPSDEDLVALRGHWLSLLGGVDWPGLLSREVVLAARIEGGRAQILCLFRLPLDAERRVLEGLRRLAYAACALSTEYEISESWLGADKTLVLSDLPGAESLCLASRGDTLLFSTSPSLLRRSIQLLDGGGIDLGFPWTVARTKGLDGLRARGRGEALEFELHARVAEIVPQLSSLSTLESIVVAGNATDDALGYAFRWRFSGASGGLLRTAILERPAIGPDWRRWVPAGVDGFEVSAGADPAALVELARRLAEEAFPEGTVGTLPDLRAFSSLLSGRRVVLDGFGGAAVLLELAPEVGEGPEGEERVDGLLGSLQRSLAGREVPFRRERLDGLGAMLAVGGSAAGAGPALWIGDAGPYLAFGTSADLLRRAVRARESGADGLALDALFSSPESRIPDGELLAVRYGRPPLAESLGRRLGVLVPPAARDAARKVPGRLREGGWVDVVFRLAPVLEALSFLRQEIRFTIRDGDALEGRGTIRLGDGPADIPERNL